MPAGTPVMIVAPGDDPPHDPGLTPLERLKPYGEGMVAHQRPPETRDSASRGRRTRCA